MTLLVRNIAQLAVVPGDGPARGAAMRDIGLIADAAMLVDEGIVTWVGPEAELPTVEIRRELDAGRRAVVPGFVDPHTHVIFAGDRVDEFEMRLAGATYPEILAAGGGILSTVRQSRAATIEELIAATRPRLEAMVAHGTTTVEAKTGYGLATEPELRALRAILALERVLPMTIVPTFMPAHAFPPHYRDREEAYVDLIVDEMLPAAIREMPEGTRLFADVFCEAGVFSVEQSARILRRAAELGYGLKIHSDEFEALGGTTLAVELDATSADHLMSTPPEEIARLARSRTVAVLLPGTTFGLGKDDWADARGMISAGVAVALATDMNPGTCWCVSMALIMAIATRYLRMTPAEALVAATRNAAAALDLAGRRGSLAPGYQADFLVLATDDYRDLSYRFGENLVEKVWIAGRPVVE